MKRIVTLLGCVLFSTQLIAEHSWAQCEGCVNGSQYRSMKSSFDPEWKRWNEGDTCESCGNTFGQSCQEDDSELVNPV
ncbi:MAG: hypothetical protein K2X90_01120 [Candidatus Babeliaceae bacterium]|nr:hypothetical protein [Candidatus Babeliaceae bacterium]